MYQYDKIRLKRLLLKGDSHMSLVVIKPVFRVSDLVQHKLGYTTTEDGWRLEISYLGSRGIVLCSENKGADQLRGYREADLRLCFRKCKKACFLMTRLIFSSTDLITVHFSIVCPDKESQYISMWTIISKVRLEAFMWVCMTGYI